MNNSFIVPRTHCFTPMNKNLNNTIFDKMIDWCSVSPEQSSPVLGDTIIMTDSGKINISLYSYILIDIFCTECYTQIKLLKGWWTKWQCILILWWGEPFCPFAIDVKYLSELAGISVN